MDKVLDFPKADAIKLNENFFKDRINDKLDRTNDPKGKDTKMISILFIEDDEDTQDLFRAFFKMKPYAVDIVDDPLKALKKIRSSPMSYDVIVTDLMLPNMNGMELIKKLRDEDSRIPVILVTAKSTIETAVEAIEVGAYDFLVKPLHLPQLDISIQRAFKMKELSSENTELKNVLKAHADPKDGIIGKSAGLKAAVDLAKRVTNSTANVLITGESGTGKEVIARLIHRSGNRCKGPFIAINCSAIPENLLESELFGYAKGAFTGAIDKKAGLFEEANGGVLFLDEIGDLSLPLQAKLLRVLQERKVKRIGENQFRNIDVRILSATHKDLRSEASIQKFREDLYFRLNVIPIRIPPLRERKEDILPLAEYFLKKFAFLNNSKVKMFAPDVLQFFLQHSWKGNVRELENTIERAVVLCDGDQVEMTHLLLLDDEPMESIGGEVETATTFDENLSLDEVVKRHILMVLEKNAGARDRTAKTLGIDRKTLYRKLNDYGVH